MSTHRTARSAQVSRLITTVLISLTPALAQQVGHYLQGTGGLGSGSALPPGYYVTYLPYLNFYQSIRGPHGGSIATGDFHTGIHNLAVTYMTGKKLGQLEYGVSAVVPFVNSRLTGEVLPVQVSTAGLSDIVITPVILGLRKTYADGIFTYNIVAPAGDFDPTKGANPGLGFWTHMFQAGTSFGFDKTRTWNGTILTTWELHTQKKGLDLTVGPQLTAEYAFGRHFMKGRGNIGAAGYYYQKLSADSGSAINPLILGLKDRMAGLGPEIQFMVPKWKLAFMARYQPQFAVRNRLQANVFLASVTFLHMAH